MMPFDVLFIVELTESVINNVLSHQLCEVLLGLYQ